jgi:hypothetical protein
LRHVEFRTDVRKIIEEITSRTDPSTQFQGPGAANEPSRVDRLRIVDALFREKMGGPPIDRRQQIDVLLGLLDGDEPILTLASASPPDEAEIGWCEMVFDKGWRQVFQGHLLAATTRRLIFVASRTLQTSIIPYSEVLAADPRSRWYGKEIHLSTPTGVKVITSIEPSERAPELLEIIRNRMSR